MTQHAAELVQVRGTEVRSLHKRGVTWVAFEPMPELEGGINFAIRKLPGLGILSGTVEGIRHHHTREDGDNDFSFHLNLSGLSTVAGRGREILLRGGDAMLLSYTESRTITRPGPVHHRVLRLPRASLAPLVRHIDDAVLRAIPRGTGVLAPLSHYSGALLDDPALAVPETRQLIATQLCDLIAVTLGATRDGAAIAEGRGIRVARLRAIKSDIEARLTHADLSVSAVAKRQRISESYIRKLFESEDTSFSEFVLGRRLVRAHRILIDRRHGDRSIAWIAFACGFGDLSYFNRTFKRLFGLTPSDTRSATGRQELTRRSRGRLHTVSQ
jgi:AraC-like DNA-binding protein